MEKTLERLLKNTPILKGHMEGHLGEILYGAAISLVLRVLGAGLAFLFNWILARRCGADGAGLYYLALTVLTLGTVVGKLGLDNTLLRFIAAGAAVRNWASVKGVYQKGMALALLASGALSLVVFLAAGPIAEKVFHKPELTGPLRWMALAIAPMSFLTLQAEALKGLKRIKDSVLVTNVALPALTCLGLVLWLKSEAQEAALVYLLATVLTALLGYFLWRAATPRLVEVIPKFKNKHLIESGRPLFITTVFETLTQWMSMFFLGIWATKAEVGVFGTALRVSMAVSVILSAVNSISAPKFAELYKKKKMKDLDHAARQSARLMTLLAGPILAVFLIFPGFIMGLFGPDFRSGAWLLAIMAIGQFVNVATGSVGYLLIMSGHEKLIQNRAVFIALLCLVLNLVLIPPFGTMGAAIATSLGVAATNLIAVYLVHEKLEIWTVPEIFRGSNNG
ncbi:MAG TPA: flippase [bacterium]|nr:flippase [bacterium]